MAKKPLILAWTRLSRETQDLYLTILWKDGHSEQAIADFLKTTKGTIVRRRQTGLKLATGKRGTVKSKVNRDRFLDLLDVHRMEVLEEQNPGVLYMEPPSETDAPVQGRPKEPCKPKLVESKREPAIEVPAPATPRKKPRAEIIATTESLPAIEPPWRKAPYRGEPADSPPPKARPTLAASEATQCTYRDEDHRRCAYAYEDLSTKRCRLHPK